MGFGCAPRMLGLGRRLEQRLIALAPALVCACVMASPVLAAPAERNAVVVGVEDRALRQEIERAIGDARPAAIRISNLFQFLKFLYMISILINNNESCNESLYLFDNYLFPCWNYVKETKLEFYILNLFLKQFMSELQMKRARVTEKAVQETQLPSSIIIKLSTHDGTTTGNPIEVPIQSTSTQLEVLLNSLLENEDKV